MASAASTTTTSAGFSAVSAIPPFPELCAGDQLDQPTFHARYEAMPAHVRAELIGGMVHMPSPMKMPHSHAQSDLNHWLCEYRSTTPEVDVASTPSVILGQHSEPQPDLCLILRPEFGGRTTIRDDYLVGSPELIVEIAYSTEAIDLHAKKLDYERAGVGEYLVVTLRNPRIFGFVLRDGRFSEQALGGDGIWRSERFPGLWLDGEALLARNAARVSDTLRRGMATAEYAAWRQSLVNPPGR